MRCSHGEPACHGQPLKEINNSRVQMNQFNMYCHYICQDARAKTTKKRNFDNFRAWMERAWLRTRDAAWNRTGVYSSVASRCIVLRRVDAARSQYDVTQRNATLDERRIVRYHRRIIIPIAWSARLFQTNSTLEVLPNICRLVPNRHCAHYSCIASSLSSPFARRKGNGEDSEQKKDAGV